VTRLDDGVLDVGSATRVKQPGMPALVWHVTELALGRAFTWEARSGGIVTIARHDISPADGGGSEVTLGIDQRGPIAWLLHLCFGGRTRRYVEAEARGLKRRAEVA
jgi:hypothetical protein